jgi:hypothetical protein
MVLPEHVSEPLTTEKLVLEKLMAGEAIVIARLELFVSVNLTGLETLPTCTGEMKVSELGLKVICPALVGENPGA